MPLKPGTQIGPYEITAPIGAGGMGEVYRATDSKLKRDVAIKVLPADVAQDRERLARFEREAHVLASLNHPHIAAIYGLEDSGGVPCLVLELVEGQTLAERIAAGPLPVDEALDLARQMASALEAAHEKGIIHRDLKPANVKLTTEGRIKVLDFGLAKGFETGTSSDSPSASPTVTTGGTRQGVLLGTVTYMSPEQARGKQVDKRTDIWAFGVVLWEMLTGNRLFGGESVAETFAAVLKLELNFELLPPRTPSRIRRLLERCLRRDRQSRLRDIGDARIVLEESIAGREWESARDVAAPATRHVPAFVAALLIAVGLALGIGLTFLWLGRSATPQTPITSVAIPIGSTLRVGDKPLLTPDGRTAILRAIDVDPDAPDHRPSLYIRRLEDNRLSKLSGTAGVIAHALSPEGRWVAFIKPASPRSSRYQLMKVPVDQSAPPLKIADWPDAMRPNLVWAKTGQILGFRDRDKTILPFSSDGGPPGDAVEIHSDLNPRWVDGHSALPGGRHILVYYATFESGAYRQDVGVLDSETGELRHLVADASRPWYALSGHLVFSRGGALLAAPFDTQRLKFTAGPQSVLDGLWSEGLYTGGIFSVSAKGDLLYGAGRVQGMSRFLAILTRDGEATTWSEDRLFYNRVWGSPDGRRLAVQIDNIGEGDALLQIRVSDVDRPRLVTVGAQPGKDCGSARWSTDSRRLAYLCWDQKSTSLHVTTVDGAPSSELLFDEPTPIALDLVGFPATDSNVFLRRVNTDGSVELISVSLPPPTGSELTPQKIPMKEREWSRATTSADGRWLAYISNEAGRRELFVREVLSNTSLGPRVFASSDVDDEAAVWSKQIREGRYELFFIWNEQLSSVEVATVPSVRISEPRELPIDLFSLGTRWLDSLPDGRLLIVRAPDTEEGAPELRLVLNWTHELAKRIPVTSE